MNERDGVNPLNFDIFNSNFGDNALLYSKNKQEYIGGDSPMHTDGNGVRNGTC